LVDSYFSDAETSDFYDFYVSYCDSFSDMLLRVGANSEISILAEEESIGLVADIQLNKSPCTSLNRIPAKLITIRSVFSFRPWFHLQGTFKVQKPDQVLV